eukprot:4637745-Lingulodinium_polyedra.AAC.1
MYTKPRTLECQWGKCQAALFIQENHLDNWTLGGRVVQTAQAFTTSQVSSWTPSMCTCSGRPPSWRMRGSMCRKSGSEGPASSANWAKASAADVCQAPPSKGPKGALKQTVSNSTECQRLLPCKERRTSFQTL